MDYVKHHNINGKDYKEIPCILGEGKPTDVTAGAVGCFYIDTDTGTLYKCIAIEDGKYIWELNDVEAVLKNKGVRETIYIGLDGYCYSADGIAYSILNLNIQSEDDLKKYNFVLLWDVQDWINITNLDIAYVGTGEMYFSSLVYDSGEYWLIAGEFGGSDEAVYFSTIKITGDYLKNYYGALHVDKPALLGDIGDQTMKEYTDKALSDLKVDTDQTYNPESENAISGAGVKDALENQSSVEYTAKHLDLKFATDKKCKVNIESTDTEVKLYHSGKNILKKFESRTISGITATVDDDGTITLNGTLTVNAPYGLVVLSMLFDDMPFNGTASNYYASVWYDAPAPHSSGYVMFRVINKDGANLITASVAGNATQGYISTLPISDIANTTETLKEAQIYLYNVPINTEFKNWKIKVQLERVDRALDSASGAYSVPSLNVYTLPVENGVATTELTLPSGENYFTTSADALMLSTTTQTPIQSYLGKRWACFGDSITYKAAGSTELRYHDLVAKDLGLSVINYGRATTGYATTGNVANGEFYKRMENIDADSFDVLTIMGSCNDFGVMSRGEMELGTYADTGTETVCGCINTTIDKFYELAPFKRLGIITMLPTYSYGPNLIDLEIAENYVNALIQICKNRGIPCLDLYHGSGLRPWIPEVRDTFFLWDEANQRGDGIHPNDEGVKFFAPLVREFVKSLI